MCIYTECQDERYPKYKTYISETNCHTCIWFMSSERKTLKVLIMLGLRACTSWPLASSVTMSTLQEQVQCVLWLAELQSHTAVQHHFRMQYGRQPPIHKSIWFCDNKLRTMGSLLRVKSPGKAFQPSLHKPICAASLQLCTNSTFNSAQCAIQKALPKSIKDSTDSCTKTEWSSSTHKLCCGYTRKNWRVSRFPPPSVLLGWGDVPCQWSCKQIQLQDLGQSKSTCHMSCREAAPKWTCEPT
jgi:hypothetical protein